MRILYLFVVMLMVSSCGYQLRGSMNVDGLENIIIIPNGHTSISSMLSQKLSSSVISQNQDYDTYPVVKINSISSQKRQLSVNSSGRVDEYEIIKSLDYEIIISENDSVKEEQKDSTKAPLKTKRKSDKMQVSYKFFPFLYSCFSPVSTG